MAIGLIATLAYKAIKLSLDMSKLVNKQASSDAILLGEIIYLSEYTGIPIVSASEERSVLNRCNFYYGRVVKVSNRGRFATKILLKLLQNSHFISEQDTQGPASLLLIKS